MTRTLQGNKLMIEIFRHADGFYRSYSHGGTVDGDTEQDVLLAILMDLVDLKAQVGRALMEAPADEPEGVVDKVEGLMKLDGNDWSEAMMDGQDRAYFQQLIAEVRAKERSLEEASDKAKHPGGDCKTCGQPKTGHDPECPHSFDLAAEGCTPSTVPAPNPTPGGAAQEARDLLEACGPWTKGGWRQGCSENKRCDCGLIWTGDGAYSVAHVYGPREASEDQGFVISLEHQRAIAKLVARAPELLRLMTGYRGADDGQ